MKPPTLECVAGRANVGRSTVSLVLNGRGDEVGIKRETQDHVLAIARELDYRANPPHAQGLAGKAMKGVGVIWSFAMYHPNHLVRSRLTMRIHDRGYRTYMVDSLSELQKVRADLQDLVRRGIDALVINFTRRCSTSSRPAATRRPGIRRRSSKFPCASCIGIPQAPAHNMRHVP